VHANKETNKNSHLITQEGSNVNSQESFGSLGNFLSGKKGGIESLQIEANKEENESKATRNDLEDVSNGLR
jgi:hypothetical protein